MRSHGWRKMSVTQPRPTPRLADHVRACVIGDQMIFLDLLRSKYIGVGGPHLHALYAAILGGALADGASPLISGPNPVDHWIQRLRRDQLLSDSPHRESQLPPAMIEPVTSLDTDDAKDVGADWRDLLRLWHSTGVASAWLRWSSLADIADRVIKLRTRNSSKADRISASALRAAVGSYLRLRPFALTSHDRCLKDSLTLVHFLASQGLFPQWVIGVQVHPFRAHSWVQIGGVVLNDTPEYVRTYQPILIV